MHPDLLPTLAKAAIPAATIGVILGVTRLRGVDWERDLALTRPRPRALASWLSIWIAWIVACEFAITALGMEQAAPWKPYPLHIIALRIAAIGLLGPAAEEILVRGLLFHKIAGTRLGPAGAIVIGAALWAAVHYQYEPATLVLIFLDGLVLGLARHRSRSTFVPIAMHSLGNLVSIAQSLAG